MRRPRNQLNVHKQPHNGIVRKGRPVLDVAGTRAARKRRERGALGNDGFQQKRVRRQNNGHRCAWALPNGVNQVLNGFPVHHARVRKRGQLELGRVLVANARPAGTEKIRVP